MPNFGHPQTSKWESTDKLTAMLTKINLAGTHVEINSAIAASLRIGADLFVPIPAALTQTNRSNSIVQARRPKYG